MPLSLSAPLRSFLCLFLLTAHLDGGLAASISFGESPTLVLFTNTQVTGEGIFLSQVAAASNSTAVAPEVHGYALAHQPSTPTPSTNFVLPLLRLSDAPAFGHWIILSRADIGKLAQKAAPEFAFTNWAGAERVRVTRLSRLLKEDELKEQITALLQREQVRDKGELELHFLRSWTAISIPDEPFSIKALDLPASGVSANFILRFEIGAGKETIGAWQMPLTAKVWREIWVARSNLKRNQPFSDADVVQERRDVLALRDAPLILTQPETSIEIAETITAGSPIYARSVHIRPVVRRGQLVEAQLQEGAMMISLKVEVLENGGPGQFVRVRNPESKREFRGKVQNEQTILIPL